MADLQTPATYAVLVGVNDYTAFDDSGADNLRGAVNDALGAARLALSLGCLPENIVLCLAEPGACADTLRERLDPRLAGAQIRGASASDVLGAIAWLADAMAMPRSKGLLWFSGHGFADAAGPALCPADTRPSERTPTNLIRNKMVLDRLAVRHPESHLTVFIDACHSAAEAVPGGMRPRALSASMHIPPGSDMDLCYEAYGNVVAIAARASEQGWELTSVEDRHGAFSWALLTVLRRWGVTDRPIGEALLDRFVDLTYADLMDKVRRLLDTLEVPQRPTLYAPAMTLNRTIFHAFGNTDMDSAPPPDDGGRELYPGDGGKVLSYIIDSTSNDGATDLYLAGPGLPASSAWAEKTMYFDEALPTGSFSISGGTLDVLDSVSPKASWRAYGDRNLADYTKAPLSPHWIITTGAYFDPKASDYTIVGGLSQGSAGLAWYRVDYDGKTNPTRIVNLNTTTLYFTLNTTASHTISPKWHRFDKLL